MAQKELMPSALIHGLTVKRITVKRDFYACSHPVLPQVKELAGLVALDKEHE